MKYIAVFDDNFLSQFRLDDNGLTLVLTDKRGTTRAVPLKPIIRPIFTSKEGESFYLSNGYIDAMWEYELGEGIVRLIKNINGYEDI